MSDTSPCQDNEILLVSISSLFYLNYDVSFLSSLQFALFRAVNNLVERFEGILWFAKLPLELTQALTTDPSDMNNSDINTYQIRY